MDLQTDYYGLVTKTIRKIRQRAMEVLQDKTLVDLIIEWLVANLDEECLHALGKNTAVVGSKDKKNTITRMLQAGLLLICLTRANSSIYY